MTTPTRKICERCNLSVEADNVIAGLCHACLVVVAKSGAVLLKVDADLRARGVPHDARAALCRALLAQVTTLPRVTAMLPSLELRALEALTDGSGELAGSSSSDRLEALSAIGAGAWERWVASEDHSAGRVERLLALRPYRRQVVRIILEGIAEGAGIVWQ